MEDRLKEIKDLQVPGEEEKKMVSFEWPYFKLVKGRLIDETGQEGNKNWPSFKSEEEAESYLEKHDIRGNVQTHGMGEPDGNIINSGFEKYESKTSCDRYMSSRGPVLHCNLDREDYIILRRKGNTIDISFAEELLRLYTEKQWKVHPMDNDSQSRNIEVLKKS